jgi:hypothetical protein
MEACVEASDAVQSSRSPAVEAALSGVAIDQFELAADSFAPGVVVGM